MIKGTFFVNRESVTTTGESGSGQDFYHPQNSSITQPSFSIFTKYYVFELDPRVTVIKY